MVIRRIQLSQSYSVWKKIHFISRKGQQEEKEDVGDGKWSDLTIEEKNSRRKCLGNRKLQHLGYLNSVDLKQFKATALTQLLDYLIQGANTSPGPTKLTQENISVHISNKTKPSFKEYTFLPVLRG